MSETAERRQRIDRWIIGGVAIVGITLGVAGCIASTVNNGDDEGNKKAEAISECESRIEGMLKAPTTATFDSQASGSTTFTVTGTVDAENSFGAMIRSTYQCTVTVRDSSTSTSVDYLE